jgi:hypothetical protein
MVVRMKHVIVLALAIAGALAAGAERAAEATAGGLRPPVPLAACAAAGVPVAAMPTMPMVRASLAVRPAGQVRHYPKPNITFSASTTVEGEVRIEASGGDFGFRKRVQSTGAYTLDLEAGGDTLRFRVTGSDITITRGKQVVIITPDSPESVATAVRRMLSDSTAVKKLRETGAMFEAEDDDSPAAAAVLLSDAVVGALTGDVGAPHRIARLLAKRARALSRSAGQRPPSCYSQWEQTMMWVWMDFEECTVLQNLGPWCTLRWTMQTESAWFSLLSCSGLGLR